MKEAQLYYRPQKIVQYELGFDRNDFQRISPLRFSNPDLYRKKSEQLSASTLFNITTGLGERFETTLSRRRDKVVNGKICSWNKEEPLEDVYERGRVYRAENGSSAHDQQREKTEVDRFMDFIQPTLLDKNTPVGAIIVSISPPGGKDSIYKHNFLDQFKKCRDEDGNIYIEAVRKATDLSLSEYFERVRKINPVIPTPIVMNDLFFMRHQLYVDPTSEYGSLDKLQEFFHKGDDFMSEEIFEEIIQATMPYIHAYIALMKTSPLDVYKQTLFYRAILNKADAEWKQSEDHAGYMRVVSERPIVSFVPSFQQIHALGVQAVREKNTGCGFSGGGSISIFGEMKKSSVTTKSSPFSVIDFGKKDEDEEVEADSKGSLLVECPTCEWSSKRRKNELLDACLVCGSEEIACDPNKKKDESRDLKEAA